MRKTKAIKIPEGDPENRDAGKTFVITELPADQAERWATKALLMVSRSGAELPPGVAGSGMAGVAIMGLKLLAGVQFEEARVLMDEMFTCVKFVPNTDKPEYSRAPIGDDIEEVSTRMLLRSEIFELHTGFSLGDLRQISKALMASPDSTNTSTSPEPSGPLSPPEAQA